MKRAIASVLACLLLLLSCPALAQEAQATAILSVSETDENGDILVSLSIKNAVFQGVQATIFYDAENAQLTDEAVGEMVVGEKAVSQEGQALSSNIFMEIRTENNKEEGWFSYTAVTNIGLNLPVEQVNENREIVADDNGVSVLQFKLRQTGEAFPEISFAAEGKTAFDSTNPNGITLSNAGTNLSVIAKLKTPVTEQESLIVPVVKEPEKTVEQQRKERIKDTVIFEIGNYAAVKNGELYWIDEENKNVVPYIINGRTMIPLRFIAEFLGLSVEWVEETQEIIMSDAETVLKMQIGNTLYTKNGETFSMEAAPELSEERTFVPLRAIAEAFDRSVHWMEKEQCVIIAPGDAPWDETNSIEKKLLQDAIFIMSPMIRDMK